MVNGSWTEDHINRLWGQNVHKIYPPCDVQEFKQLKRDPEKEEDCDKIKTILSIGTVQLKSTLLILGYNTNRNLWLVSSQNVNTYDIVILGISFDDLKIGRQSSQSCTLIFIVLDISSVFEAHFFENSFEFFF